MLHSDIVPSVFYHLSPHDLFATSNVCRALQEPALKELLSRPIIFQDFIQIDQWYQSMQTRLGDSWPRYLRDLTFYFCDEPKPGSETTLQHVLNIFIHATRLRRLSLLRADHLLLPESGIPAAISALEHLESFYVKTEEADEDTGVQSVVADLLAEMRSPLTFLALHTSHYSGEWAYHDLSRILAPHLNHLSELTLGSPETLTPEVRSPTLAVLTISLREDAPNPRQLYEAFPNLHTLVLSDCTDYFELDYADADCERMRAERLAEQVDGHVWSSLVVVQGDLAQLYLLGLACPIFRLVLLQYRPHWHSAAVELVRCASPRYLTLNTVCNARRREDSTSVPESLLTQGSRGREYVTHLTMDITAEWENWPQTNDFAHHIIRTIASSRVMFLRVIIGRGGRSAPEDDLLGPTFPIDTYTALSLQTLDVDLLGRRILEVGTSLRALAFTIAGRGQHLAWLIERTDSSLRITELDASASATLIQKEGL